MTTTALATIATPDAPASPLVVPFHPLADIFPLIEGDEFDDLVESIRISGLRDPIILYQDQILDGRNRYRACEKAGANPHYQSFVRGDPLIGDPLQFVIDRNLRRRHLDSSQRAMIAAKLETLKHGGDRKLDQDANLQVDRSTAAKLLNVSERSVASAAKVLDNAAPEIVAAVERGEIAVSAAAKAARDHTRIVMGSSKSDEWYSPKHVAELAVEMMGGIDLDPCWHPDSPVQAATTYTAKDDGLSKPWRGNVFLNPPHKTIDEWIVKLVEEYTSGNVKQAIALLPARVDAEWFRRLAVYPRCFIRGRLRFENSDTSAPFPSAVVYLGPNVAQFERIFDAIGDAYTRYYGAVVDKQSTDKTINVAANSSFAETVDALRTHIAYYALDVNALATTLEGAESLTTPQDLEELAEWLQSFAKQWRKMKSDNKRKAKLAAAANAMEATQ